MSRQTAQSASEVWDELARRGPIASVLDPNDRFGKKNLYIDLMQRIALEPLLHIENKIVLEFGCGTGRWFDFTNRRAKKVYGLDVSPELLKMAKLKARPGRCEVVCYDGLKIPFERNFFDAILSVGTLQTIQDPIHFQSLVSQLVGCLKVSGKIYLYEQARLDPKWNQKSVEDYERAFVKAGCRYLDSFPVRSGRSLTRIALQLGLVPKAMLPRLATRELARAGQTRWKWWHRYQEYVFVFEKR